MPTQLLPLEVVSRRDQEQHVVRFFRVSSERFQQRGHTLRAGQYRDEDGYFGLARCLRHGGKTMLGCLLWVVVWAVVAVIVLLVFEQVMNAIGWPITTQIMNLLRLLVGLLVLI